MKTVSIFGAFQNNEAADTSETMTKFYSSYVNVYTFYCIFAIQIIVARTIVAMQEAKKQRCYATRF
jgi:hypothetical protein